MPLHLEQEEMKCLIQSSGYNLVEGQYKMELKAIYKKIS